MGLGLTITNDTLLRQTLILFGKPAELVYVDIIGTLIKLISGDLRCVQLLAAPLDPLKLFRAASLTWLWIYYAQS